MALGAQGTLFVGTRSTTVYSVSGSPDTGLKPVVRVVADKLNMPNGVAFRDGAGYVAEINRILRYDAIESSLDKVPAPKVVRDD
jgi:glucose/arabinose dehydrogenase